jgi:hypothetical protein
MFFFSSLYCNGQYLFTIDSLLNLDLRDPQTKVFYLANALKNYRLKAESEIKWVKQQEFINAKDSSSKRVIKRELCYEKAKRDVDKYLNEFSTYLKKDGRERNDYIKCNNDLRKALLSIRKLYKIFFDRKHNNDNGLKIFLPKRTSINKVTKCTLEWEFYFKDSRPGLSEIYIRELSRGYWSKELYK